jgi:hypothetical protein
MAAALVHSSGSSSKEGCPAGDSSNKRNINNYTAVVFRWTSFGSLQSAQINCWSQLRAAHGWWASGDVLQHMLVP